MGNKEEKFLEQLIYMSKECEKIISLIKESFKNPSYEFVFEAKNINQAIRNILPKIYQKANKAYNSPYKYNLAVKIVDNLCFSTNEMHKVLIDNNALNKNVNISNLETLINLVNCTFIEMTKILQYTQNIEENYMKIEARKMKILEYEKRANTCYVELVENLYNINSEYLCIMSYKRIVDGLYNIFNKSVESVIFLETLL